jgi:hypothetical protein
MVNQPCEPEGIMKAPITNRDLIGNWIFFRLMSNSPKELEGQNTGIGDLEGWIEAKLLGVDEIGIWLENPHFKIPVPPDQQKEPTEVSSSVLIKWQFIVSIICVDADESEHDKPSMGFSMLGQL